MRKHQIISAVGAILMGFAVPYLFFTSNAYEAAIIVASFWVMLALPFTLYLGYISGKYFRKMWVYPLAYSVLLLSVLVLCNWENLYGGNIGIFAGLAALCVVSFLFWSWFYRDFPKKE